MRILYKQYKRYVGVGKAILLGTLLLQSCSSPLDIDTSRERIVEEELAERTSSTKVPTTSIQFIYQDGAVDPNSEVTLDILEMAGMIDTAEDRLWIRGAWQIPQSRQNDLSWSGIRQIFVRADSVDLSTPSHNLANSAGTDSARILLQMGLVELDFFPGGIFPNGEINLLELKDFTHDRAARRVTIAVKGEVRPYGRSFEFTGFIEVEY